MGEAKRRKQRDNNYGKAPEWKILTEEDENYHLLESIASEAYSGLSNVFRLQINYPNGETYIGLEHLYVDLNSGKVLYGEGVWMGLNKGLENLKSKTGLELKKVVLQPLAKIFRNKVLAAKAVIINS